jgi:hypothetical protein
MEKKLEMNLRTFLFLEFFQILGCRLDCLHYDKYNNKYYSRPRDGVKTEKTQIMFHLIILIIAASVRLIPAGA